MELPNIGTHCTVTDCKQLDFLPFKCSGCKQMFCQEHWRFNQHACPNELDVIENRIVPECPICGVTVPVKPGEDANIRMDQHIAQNCSDPGKAAGKPIYTNSCRVEGCKKKEVVPFKCKDCGENYCIRHRSPLDHLCEPDKKTVSQHMRGLFVSGNDAASNTRNGNAATGRGKNSHRNKQDACCIS